MKTIWTTVLVCAFLQVLWVSLSTGQTDCPTLPEQGACCAASCVYVNCTVNNEMVSRCYNDTGAANCTDQAEAVDICPKASEVNCTSLDQTHCCDAANNSCLFYNCTKPDGTVDTVCAAADANTTTVCPDGTATNICVAADSCQAHNESQTECCGAVNISCEFYNCVSATANSTVCVPDNTSTPCPNTTTASAYLCKSTTPSPLTTAAPVTCEEQKEKKGDCCALACSFFNCTDTSGVTSTVCTNKTADICPNSTTPSEDMCKGQTTVAPTTVAPTAAPTQSPSTGGDDGQQFDAASFIGGIVLCAGLVAIAYFGLKFYRSRQERNYHTL